MEEESREITTEEQFLEIKQLLLDIKMTLLSIQGNQYQYTWYDTNLTEDIEICGHIHAYWTSAGLCCPKCGGIVQ